MKRLRFIYGGTRCGDTLHAVPFLQRCKEWEYTVDWVHGPYAKEVIAFLKNEADLSIDQVIECPEPVGPGDLGGIIQFKSKVDRSHDQYEALRQRSHCIFEERSRPFD